MPVMLHSRCVVHPQTVRAAGKPLASGVLFRPAVPVALPQGAAAALHREPLSSHCRVLTRGKPSDSAGGKAAASEQRGATGSTSSGGSDQPPEPLPRHVEEMIKSQMEFPRSIEEEYKSKIGQMKELSDSLDLHREAHAQKRPAGAQPDLTDRIGLWMSNRLSRMIEDSDEPLQQASRDSEKMEASLRSLARKQIDAGITVNLGAATEDNQFSLPECVWVGRVAQAVTVGLLVGLPAALLGFTGSWQLPTQGWSPCLQWTLPLAAASAAAAAVSTLADGGQVAVKKPSRMQVLALGVTSLTETLLYRGMLLAVLLRVLGGDSGNSGPLLDFDTLATTLPALPVVFLWPVLTLSVGLAEGVVTYKGACQGATSPAAIRALHSDTAAVAELGEGGRLYVQEDMPNSLKMRWQRLIGSDSSLPMWLAAGEPDKQPIWPIVRSAVTGSFLTAEALLLGSLPAVAVTSFTIALARAALSPPITRTEEFYVGDGFAFNIMKADAEELTDSQ